MRRAKEIQQAINNIGYYASTINRLAKEELEENIREENVDILGAIGNSVNNINFLCQDINDKLKEAK